MDTIGHDPNELISYLTAKFNAFTPAQVQAELQALFDQQYTLTTREEVQIRYRTVTWTDEEGNEHESEEAYEYYICLLYTSFHTQMRAASRSYPARLDYPSANERHCVKNAHGARSFYS